MMVERKFKLKNIYIAVQIKTKVTVRR